MTDKSKGAYDFEANRWVPQCPYGDVCTGCDAAGKCSRAIESKGATSLPRDERGPSGSGALVASDGGAANTAISKGASS